ncbi:ABC transporter substrate-binding protein [Ruminiclostridium papyrosolvens]|uniref:Sugar ABC transporter substrate-binding protein n=1 Tax=Ruminiclostridium papyrosolvens C7 TaxID=1330534 RepID=U4R651_9FIRM|nr:ABC transporter substrate-binding protein [Ruminiclostridium papyrosolvens]EPR14309.1 sugar ABC transporter substrate-binding protein [Ruminiclostridium papyrosolvens C7]
MMLKKRNWLVALLTGLLSVSFVLTGCGGSDSSSSSTSTSGSATATGSASAEKLDPIEISFFIADPGQAPTPDNKIYKRIKEELGVTCNFEFLVGDKNQKIGVMIAGGEYPDVITLGSDTVSKFTGAGALVPLEDIIEKDAPNLKKHFDPYKNKVKDVTDGHFYVMPGYGVYYNDFSINVNEGPAFFMQKAVLKDAGYPKVKTLDQYFDLIEKYKAKNPTIDGQPTIGFEVLSEGWRDFCLKNPPQHLIGHPNDGGVVVDNKTNTAEFFWDKDYAKRYYKKLNEVNAKGLLDPESFTMNYDQYIAKLSSGRVLGMFDQHWNFSNAELTLKTQKKFERTYAPLPVVFDEGTQDYYMDRPVLNVNTGYAITKSAKDPARIVKFFDALLTEKWQKILGWGIEGEDYKVDDKGSFYMTPEQRVNYNDQTWRLGNMAHTLWYYAPKMEGTFSDGNATGPGGQPKEYYDALDQYDKDFLKAYGYDQQSDFFSPAPENRISYPAWQIDLVDGSPASMANTKAGDIATKFLPKAILAKPDKFDSVWDEYVNQLHKEDIQAYVDRINDQLKWRAENWK